MNAKVSAIKNIDFAALADDFKNLNPNDPGSWPWLPKIAALLAILIVTVALGWWFVWNDQLETLTQRETEEAKLKTEYLDKKKQAINLDLYTQQLNEIDQTFGALLKQLPNKSEMDALLTEVNQAGLGRGLQFELFKPGAEQIKDFYAELPIQIKLTGNYHDFGAFAADIGRLPRIVTLNNIVVAPGTGGGAARLSLEAVVKTFRYLDQEELAKVKAAAKAGAKK